MAKSKKGAILIRLVYKNPDNNNKIDCFYTTKKPSKYPKKLSLKKYHPVLKKHVLFEEAKIK